MTNRIKIGTSPAGVEWVCYRRDGEAVEAFAVRVATMRDRLTVRRAKWDAVLARAERAVSLTRGEARWLDYSMQNLPDQDTLDDGEWGKLSSSYRVGATYVRGTAGDLEILATCAANILASDDHVDAVRAPEGGSLWDRNLERAETCLRSVVAKLTRVAKISRRSQCC